MHVGHGVGVGGRFEIRLDKDDDSDIEGNDVRVVRVEVEEVLLMTTTLDGPSKDIL